ncbi:nucleotide sugar dehydrogenase [Patescibacteria group bacterium]
MSRIKKSSKKKYYRSRGTIAVIGLGYVGLPLACIAAEKGYKVIGVAKNKAKIELINNGQSPIADRQLKSWLKNVSINASSDYNLVQKAKIIIVSVPTPVDEFYNPDLRPLKSACESIRKNLKKGQLVVIESTVNPGICEEVVKPILEKSKLVAGRDFYLSHCPERINPGDKRWNVKNIPRVVGALTKKGLKKTINFYNNIIEAPLKPMKGLKEAEATKIIENSFRDVNIAFVNEMAKSFDRLGIDVLDVIEGASTKPFAFIPHYPSCGVGGHCIPVDPHYLIKRAKRSGFDHEFLKLARSINNSMPEYTVDLLANALNSIKHTVQGARVGLLGVAYKANVADVRESPAFEIQKLLLELGARLFIYDPYVEQYNNTKSLNELLLKSECLILITNHNLFITKLTPKLLKDSNISVIIDGKNALDKKAIKAKGIVYKGIGR